MALSASSLAEPAHDAVAERREVIRRESLRDFAGVAVGVAAGGLIWVAFLSLARLSS